MSSRSARNYWTDAAREQRAEEMQARLRARSEWRPDEALHQKKTRVAANNR